MGHRPSEQWERGGVQATSTGTQARKVKPAREQDKKGGMTNLPQETAVSKTGELNGDVFKLTYLTPRKYLLTARRTRGGQSSDA